MKKIVLFVLLALAAFVYAQAQAPELSFTYAPDQVRLDDAPMYYMSLKDESGLVYNTDFLLTFDAVQNGQSLYATPDTLGYNNFMGRVYPLQPMARDMQAVAAGDVTVTFYVWRINAGDADGGKGSSKDGGKDSSKDGGKGRNLSAWNDGNGEQITLSHTVNVFDIPDVQIEITSPYCNFPGASLVYNGGKIPEFTFACDEASAGRIGEDIFIVAKTQRVIPTPDKEAESVFSDTISSLTYRFSDDWASKQGEYRLDFSLIWKNGDAYVDITPKNDNFTSRKELFFYAGEPVIYWSDHSIAEPINATIGWDENDNEILKTCWYIDSYWDPYPFIVNGHMGRGTGAGRIVFDVFGEDSDEVVFSDTLTGYNIYIDSSVHAGSYKVVITLLLYDENGALLPAYNKNGELITAEYTLTLGPGGSVAVEPVLSDVLEGVRLYPNPSADGRFSVTVPLDGSVEIFSLNGSMVGSRCVNAGSAAFRLNESGVYFVRVSADGRSCVKKVVVR